MTSSEITPLTENTERSYVPFIVMRGEVNAIEYLPAPSYTACPETLVGPATCTVKASLFTASLTARSMSMPWTWKFMSVPATPPDRIVSPQPNEAKAEAFDTATQNGERVVT